ncbi:MAG TPA: two-component regulator propeller domain-containing protein [Chitinophagaceae bacterium]
MKHKLVILFVLKSIVALSQQNNNYNFRHIDQSSGLLHNEVLAITQDARGFMWIGTTNGLQRFDGQRFVNYQDQLYKDDNKLKQIESLYFDGKNILWLYGNLRLDKLDLVKNNLTNYNNDSLLNNKVLPLTSYTDGDNRPWLVGKFVVYNYDTVAKKMKSYSFDIGSLAANSSCNIFRDNKKRQTWVVAFGGLRLFDADTKKVYSNNDLHVKHPLLQLKLTKGFSKIMIDAQDNIWVTSWNHLLYRYDPLTKKIYTYSLFDIVAKQGGAKNNGGTLLVNCIYRDTQDNIWLGTENAGLLKYNRQQDNFDYIIAGEENKQGLQYNYNIFCIFQDKEENLWLGTDKGISIFNPYHQYFQSIHHEENNSSIPKNEITSFIETKGGNILAGTWGGGVAVYDSLLHFKKNIVLKGIAENNLVWSFIENDNGKIWIGCQHGYLHIYDPVNEKIIATLQPRQLDSSTIRCMQKDYQGNIWFGLHNGKIAKWDKSSNTFIGYSDNTKNASLAIAPVYNIFIDNHQNFWIGTNNGFKQFDPIKNIYTSVVSPGKSDQAIPSEQIRGIEQYNDSILIVGTVSGSLNYFNVNTGIFSRLMTMLPSNNINAIKKDAKKNIWFTTDYGLYKLSRDEKKIITYSINPGMINSSFVSVNFLQLKNKRWLTATSTEIISFYPDSLSSQSNFSKNVTITGFRIFDTTIFIDSLLSENKPVKLDYKQNFFTIEFAALDFSNIMQTKYMYRLSGIDKDWVNAGSKNFASYTNLEPGNYTFSVKAEEGEASSNIFSFSIIIAPPFWKTWWFETLVVLATATLFYLVIRKRIIAIKHEAALKQKIAETEMQALRAQMNPHFIFNCLNAIDNLIQTNQKDKATTYLARFAKLIRVVLDSSKNNVVPFYKEYEALNLFLQLEQFRCSNKFEYELYADDEITNGGYKVPPLLIQPFIENAIHHGLMNKTGNDKKLSIQIGIKNETIHYSITDNGIGRQKAFEIKTLNKPEHVSYGIDISRERVHLYNKNENEKNVVITDLYTNGSPAGTMVEVSINIHHIN